MTALADALRAAQAQAIAALGKTYLADDGDGETLRAALDLIGCTDKVEQGQLLAAWGMLRAAGAQAPEPAKPDTSHEPATERQLKFAAKLADERGTVLPDYALTKSNASKIIEELQAGTYNADAYSVPF